MGNIWDERSRSRILLDILKALREGKHVKKTRIMQRSCLDWRSFSRYFIFLMEHEFIQKSNQEEGTYELTDKGMELLKLLKALDSFCAQATANAVRCI